MIKKSPALSFLILLFGIQLFAQSAKLSIKVAGYDEMVGNLSIGLFSSSQGFPKKSENSIGVDIAIRDTVVEFTFNDLQAGEYALAIFHDENENGELDQNFLGMPTEDYVFSNYATGTFGPPSFEDAKFMIIDSLSIFLLLNK